MSATRGKKESTAQNADIRGWGKAGSTDDVQGVAKSIDYSACAISIVLFSIAQFNRSEFADKAIELTINLYRH